MKKVFFALIVAAAIMPLLPSANAADSIDSDHSVRTPISVLISKDK